MLNNIKKLYSDYEEKKRKEHLRKVRAKQKEAHRTRHLQIALTLHEALQERKHILKVDVPQHPALLVPDGVMSRTVHDYPFRVYRLPSNSRGEDSAISTETFKKIIGNYFHSCAYRGFGITCGETKETYDFAVIEQNGFELGSVHATNIGKLCFIPAAVINAAYTVSGKRGHFRIVHFNGTYHQLVPNSMFEIYSDGKWHRTGLYFDYTPGYPVTCLSASGKPLECYCGYTMRHQQ